MAVTFTKTKETIYGNDRIVHGVLDLSDQSSGAVAIPGIRRLYNIAATPESFTSTTFPKFFINQGSAATAIDGMLQIKSGTAGDAFNVVAYGD
jgi:hypothetical protein